MVDLTYSILIIPLSFLKKSLSWSPDFLSVSSSIHVYFVTQLLLLYCAYLLRP